MPPPAFPLVNGRRKSWSSIKFMNGLTEEKGISGVDFSCTVSREADMGAGRFKLGDTEGSVSYAASLTFKLENFVPFCEALAPAGGWMDTMFGMLLAFRESGDSPLIKVDLVGLLMNENGHSYSQGDGGLEVSVPLTISYYLVNGLAPVLGQPL